ncbi:DUF5412 domain-containing protein [Desulfitobacterium sp. PCE1]|uniref:DUF5412 domain-containing protein n=1 Tax=Desulfitobacterium sp. PCE1 TaxID=146907 RepID=UPI00036FEF08|nr:DUF5412 domain-containing protein [Desulfitobacterium sp. PCE1]
MRKKTRAVSIILILLMGIITYGIYWAFFDVQRINGQERLTELASPKSTYTVTAYLNNGGATTDYAVLCMVTHNKTNKQKNIYWNSPCQTASVEWIDDVTVVINEVKLDVRNDVFDYRR